MRCRIVVADDSEDDLLFFQRAVKRTGAPLDVVAMLRDGDEVVDYLRGQGQYADRQRFPAPDLLVLDIKMPRMTGLQVLEWLQTHNLPEMRVVVLTGSDLELDRVAAMALGVDAYMTKPCDPAGLLRLIESLVALC